MRGGEADAQARGALRHGGRANGRDVEAELRQLLGGAEGVLFRSDDDGMNGGRRNLVEEGREFAESGAPPVAFGSGADLERGGSRGRGRGGRGGGEDEAAGAIEEEIDERA